MAGVDDKDQSVKEKLGSPGDISQATASGGASTGGKAAQQSNSNQAKGKASDVHGKRSITQNAGAKNMAVESKRLKESAISSFASPPKFGVPFVFGLGTPTPTNVQPHGSPSSFTCFGPSQPSGKSYNSPNDISRGANVGGTITYPNAMTIRANVEETPNHHNSIAQGFHFGITSNDYSSTAKGTDSVTDAKTGGQSSVKREDTAFCEFLASLMNEVPEDKKHALRIRLMCEIEMSRK